MTCWLYELDCVKAPLNFNQPTAPPLGLRSIVIIGSVCPYESVCPHALLKNHMSKLHEIFYTC